LTNKGHDLYGKSDLRFMEGADPTRGRAPPLAPLCAAPARRTPVLAQQQTRPLMPGRMIVPPPCCWRRATLAPAPARPQKTGIYRVLRDEFGFLPKITRNQFFGSGFAEQKMILATHIMK